MSVPRATDRIVCPCPECVVWVAGNLLPCGHPACALCAREHPGVCGSCDPAPRWTRDDAWAWLLRVYISDDEVAWALRDYGDQAEKELTQYVANGWRATSGPHDARYRTWKGKVTVHDPQSGLADRGDGPGFTFTVAAVVRARLAAQPRDRIAVAPGVYQGVLL